ncbi:hypothetical protein BATDEDRAFT_21775 [Batrachochytrium dendrobatidis JAM81]|uniref:Cyclin-domain-containing protein n=1 Tax=Batrachochytrium dendrobatidis (strain JAM81 / FGSC 10211) TaxID=684364 RepID=F4NV78_BATDJ|nr:uncharacterized protein BATDEDRAFT_21775 [Batrachochytrium dendrobatidis JAM81]EGF83242.1 hypothetical protein BATDEDRAFT_21775 [Batrachochytrium dendrobatidis JAM81]|eukprot:XP_006675378.1 hypothetical protein BATDEDRAFT_21775 [Batrachochytrium dendrobatidis JAM81]
MAVFDLKNTSAADTIQLVAGYLHHITQLNDAVPRSRVLTRFHARTIPSIDIQGYLARILKYAPCGSECILAVLIYFDRMTQGSLMADSTAGLSFIPLINPTLQDSSTPAAADATADLARQHHAGTTVEPIKHSIVINSYNIHRLLITGVMVAVKFLSDVFYTNSHIAKVGGLPVQELNRLEIEFLLYNEFNLNIKAGQLQECGNWLLNFELDRQTLMEPVVSSSFKQGWTESNNPLLKAVDHIAGANTEPTDSSITKSLSDSSIDPVTSASFQVPESTHQAPQSDQQPQEHATKHSHPSSHFSGFPMSQQQELVQKNTSFDSFQSLTPLHGGLSNGSSSINIGSNALQSQSDGVVVTSPSFMFPNTFLNAIQTPNLQRQSALYHSYAPHNNCILLRQPTAPVSKMTRRSRHLAFLPSFVHSGLAIDGRGDTLVGHPSAVIQDDMMDDYHVNPAMWRFSDTTKPCHVGLGSYARAFGAVKASVYKLHLCRKLNHLPRLHGRVQTPYRQRQNTNRAEKSYKNRFKRAYLNWYRSHIQQFNVISRHTCSRSVDQITQRCLACHSNTEVPSGSEVQSAESMNSLQPEVSNNISNTPTLDISTTPEAILDAAAAESTTSPTCPFG